MMTLPKYSVEIEHKKIYVGEIDAPTEIDAQNIAWEQFENDELPLAWDDFWINDVEEL